MIITTFLIDGWKHTFSNWQLRNWQVQCGSNSQCPAQMRHTKMLTVEGLMFLFFIPLLSPSLLSLFMEGCSFVCRSWKPVLIWSTTTKCRGCIEDTEKILQSELRGNSWYPGLATQGRVPQELWGWTLSYGDFLVSEKMFDLNHGAIFVAQQDKLPVIPAPLACAGCCPRCSTACSLRMSLGKQQSIQVPGSLYPRGDTDGVPSSWFQSR